MDLQTLASLDVYHIDYILPLAGHHTGQCSSDVALDTVGLGFGLDGGLDGNFLS